MIVVDTNVLVPLYVKTAATDEHTELAFLLMHKDPQWHAPIFWRTEFANVLSTNVRFGGLDHDHARRAWSRASRIKNLREHDCSLPAALDASIAHGLSVYDSLFLALAKALKTVCVTHDAALRRAAPGLAVGVKDFLRA